MAFAYRDGALCAESVPLDEIAQRFGTPCYVYSRAEIEHNYRAFEQALAGREAMVAYSVKANSNLAVLALLAKLGSGFDIVSSGELDRVHAAGGDARKVLFSGVGKSAAEIRLALEAGVRCLNLESEAEMGRVDAIAGQLGLRAPVAFRVNPDVDPQTHPYISTGLKQSKFGIAYADADRLYREAARRRNLEVIGIGCHIGSQLVDPAPLVAATGRMVDLVERLAKAGIGLAHIDVGGGIGIRYRDEAPPPITDFLAGVLGVLGGRGETLIVDPGRAIVGSAGILLTRVEYVKPGEAKNYLIVDAAMNDLLRPALYDAWHEVLPVRRAESGVGAGVYDIVGPVCESSDFLACERRLAAGSGDLVALMCAGAYAMVMSSNYNSRPRAAEVLVDGRDAHLVRRRETTEQLYALESIPK
ncbi:MAG: diaminopimelate decarboxylase [Betaproteobacteria bacterium RIFCSPLOWO2_02_67_12]|nr:MAG: diaminopimelate decarboxylase [Betaproteobacteria bacterium RIFCSPLOWO2_02_67_12]OGA28532.1 MAG: diaminopimelate decarboxylase [Betaproteobacteria bacterium RIFCSPLOWO2_02_FULL_68_150]OGA60754.1 MAG: diaminopimelate decarboxylase [Betaproteobacteria bacterium RIFCSPLOWO2_12_FULL_67_28]